MTDLKIYHIINLSHMFVNKKGMQSDKITFLFYIKFIFIIRFS